MGDVVDALVYVVADDGDVRRSLEQPLTMAGLAVIGCGSEEELMARRRTGRPGCVVLALSRAGACALDLLRSLTTRAEIPVIFVTACPDVHVIVEAMKAGAVDVIAAPTGVGLLRDAVSAALERSRAALAREAGLHALRSCHASLTRRERDVMALVVSGLLNKQIAYELGISEITVKAHRGQVMRKMQAASLPHLVRMAGQLDAGTGAPAPVLSEA